MSEKATFWCLDCDVEVPALYTNGHGTHTTMQLPPNLTARLSEVAEARYNARVLASAWEKDAIPPAEIVKASLAYAVDQRVG